MHIVIRLGLTLALLAVSSAAMAHYIWLEADGQGAQLYFGEFGENLREVSPGLLDRLEPSARAVTPSGEKALKVEKSAGSFKLSGEPVAGASIVAEDARYPLIVRTRDGATSRLMWRPAARFVPDQAARQPILELDIVPAGGGKFAVFFKGKPLAKTKVTVGTPSGWVKELTTDADGAVATGLPWRGIYVFEVHHDDKNAGKRGEEAYDSASYVTSLTLVQPQGLDPLPAPPPAKPN
jgi:hypothetical protein